MRPCLRSHDQRRRSSTASISDDQLQKLRAISQLSAVSNLADEDDPKRFDSQSRRTSSAKHSLPENGVQMKMIITLLIIVTIVVAVVLLSCQIRGVTGKWIFLELLM